jgi:hypothetical protein
MNRRALRGIILWGTYAGQSEHGVNKQRGAKLIGTLHHIVEEIVLMKENEAVILKEEISAENRSHQIIIGRDVCPHGWLH